MSSSLSQPDEGPSLVTTFLESLVPEDPAERVEFVDGLVTDCASSTTDMLASLRQQGRSRDVEGIRRTAHSFRGASLTLGAPRLAELCRRLEAQAPAEDWPSLVTLVDEIFHEAEIVDRCLQAFRRDVAGSCGPAGSSE